MQNFATFFDKNYLSRGLVLYDSIKGNSIDFKLFVLCLDDYTCEYFKNNAAQFPEVTIVTLEEIEQADKDLERSKNSRSKIEYYFTLSPCLPLYLLKNYSIPHICTLDADILFLDNVQKLFDSLHSYSILITPHKFSNELKESIKYGKFNVSFQIFKNDEVAIACLERWRSQCIDWCCDKYDEVNNRFADQKYLDEWPALYEGKIKTLEDNTSGIAVWNLNNYKISRRKNHFYSNGKRILFYHFHHFKILDNSWATNGFTRYKASKQKAVEELYLAYWRKLKKYNSVFSISHDTSTRYIQNDNKWKKIANENYVYYKLANLLLFQTNYSKIPRIFKWFLIRINA